MSHYKLLKEYSVVRIEIYTVFSIILTVQKDLNFESVAVEVLSFCTVYGLRTLQSNIREEVVVFAGR